MGYLSELAAQLGVSLWLLVVIFIWSSVWKFIALWKSARKEHLVWFIVFALVNSIGILEILYIYIFSEKSSKSVVKQETVKNKKQDKKAIKKRK